MKKPTAIAGLATRTSVSNIAMHALRARTRLTPALVIAQIVKQTRGQTVLPHHQTVCALHARCILLLMLAATSKQTALVRLGTLATTATSARPVMLARTRQILATPTAHHVKKTTGRTNRMPSMRIPARIVRQTRNPHRAAMRKPTAFAKKATGQTMAILKATRALLALLERTRMRLAIPLAHLVEKTLIQCRRLPTVRIPAFIVRYTCILHRAALLNPTARAKKATVQAVKVISANARALRATLVHSRSTLAITVAQTAWQALTRIMSRQRISTIARVALITRPRRRAAQRSRTARASLVIMAQAAKSARSATQRSGASEAQTTHAHLTLRRLQEAALFPTVYACLVSTAIPVAT